MDTLRTINARMMIIAKTTPGEMADSAITANIAYSLRRATARVAPTIILTEQGLVYWSNSQEGDRQGRPYDATNTEHCPLVIDTPYLLLKRFAWARNGGAQKKPQYPVEQRVN